MIGIVSLLDEEHYHRVENLWDEVEDRSWWAATCEPAVHVQTK